MIAIEKDHETISRGSACTKSHFNLEIKRGADYLHSEMSREGSDPYFSVFTRLLLYTSSTSSRLELCMSTTCQNTNSQSSSSSSSFSSCCQHYKDTHRRATPSSHSQSSFRQEERGEVRACRQREMTGVSTLSFRKINKD